VRQWRQSTRWTEEGIGEEERRSWSDTVLGLAQFQSARGQDTHTLHLSKSAKRSWSAYYDRLGEEMDDDAGEALREFLTKLRPACGRLAIVLHTVEALSVGSGNAVPAQIGNETIDRAIALAEFFASQGRAVLAEVHGSRLDRSHRALVEWMKSKNCEVTARQAARGLGREFDSVPEAERALHSLVEENVVIKQYTTPSEKGGRQTATYRLSERSS
jgi:predicted ArsR family transcriptional regulator